MTPRILFISSEIPQSAVAGGLLLYRLLKDYDHGRIVVVGEPPRRESALLDCPYHSPALPWRRLERSRFNRLHRTLRTLGLVPLLPVAEIDRLLENFRPDVVISVMQFATWYESARRYAERKRIPLVTVVHDPDEVFDIVYGWASGLQRRADGRFYRSARKRLCISPEMEAHCFARYGARGEVMYPNRDEALVPRPPEASRALKTPGTLTLGYAGTLGYGYGDAFVSLLPALRAAGSRLVIYGKLASPALARLGNDPNVELRGFVADPNGAWSAIQRDCDALILAYRNPPDAAHRRLYSTHFPSKLPEYLALGMPVIIAGPPEATGVRWGIAHADAALVETDADPEALARHFRRLAADGGMRQRLAEAAIDAGKRQFEPGRIRQQFFDALETACATS